MEIKDLTKLAIEIRKKYDNKNNLNGMKPWGLEQFIQGFVGDVGDLAKYSMAYNGYRNDQGDEERLKHEVCDCLWSILVIADLLDMDLEEEFLKSKKSLENGISEIEK